MGATLEIKFDSDNEAIADDPSGESIRILDKIKKEIEANYGCACSGAIRDINGNRVGLWDLSID